MNNITKYNNDKTVFSMEIQDFCDMWNGICKFKPDDISFQGLSALYCKIGNGVMQGLITNGKGAGIARAKIHNEVNDKFYIPFGEYDFKKIQKFVDAIMLSVKKDAEGKLLIIEVGDDICELKIIEQSLFGNHPSSTLSLKIERDFNGVPEYCFETDVKFGSDYRTPQGSDKVSFDALFMQKVFKSINKVFGSTDISMCHYDGRLLVIPRFENEDKNEESKVKFYFLWMCQKDEVKKLDYTDFTLKLL